MKRHVALRRLHGLYGAKLYKDTFDKSLSRGDVEPIMYHYINSQRQMSMLHGLFSTNGVGGDAAPPPASDLANGSSGICAEYRGRTTCSAKADPIDAPWVDASAEPLIWERYLDTDAP